MRNDEQSWTDICNIRQAFITYLQNYNITAVTSDISASVIETNLQSISVSSRAYFWGQRLISNYPDSQPKELMSILATPQFYGKRRFTGVLACVPNPDRNADGTPRYLPSYFFGQTRWVLCC
jgi:hypothetical protein